MDEPGDKRHPKPFEPPPWERERFEELQRSRPDAADAREELLGLAKGAQEEQPAVDSPVVPVEQAGRTEKAPPAAKAPVGGTPPPDAHLDAMIIGLSAEERTEFGSHAFAWGMGVAAFLVFIGLVMLGYAAVAFARTRGAGAIAAAGSGIVGLFGIIILASAIWLGVRTYNNRGV